MCCSEKWHFAQLPHGMPQYGHFHTEDGSDNEYHNDNGDHGYRTDDAEEYKDCEED